MIIRFRPNGISNEAPFLMVLIGFVVLTLSEPVSTAQPADTRPRIGLALSGGGANGMAHIGVLKVMEEAGLRPDYISGVSMGSIIGAMYSLGYSADSLHSILKQMDWELNFNRIIPENKVIYSEKEHYNNSIISLSISSNKVRLPSGLINDQQVDNLISYYAWPAAGINDFSKLPIPFVCLATDILTGKLVELHEGYLPDALRASSAVPSFFPPVRIDTTLLIDGGVLRNYPAEEVRKMGADIVIGSYTGFQIYSEEQLQSVPGIIKQIAFFRSYEDFLKQKELTDIMIEPKLKGYSSTVFTDVDSVIQQGYLAALPYKSRFKRIADSINRLERPDPPEYILDRKWYSFDNIEVNGNKIYSDAQILGVLDIKPGENIDKDLLSEKIDLLYGRTWFDKIKYRILPRNDSLILSIDCAEEPNSKLFGGIYYDSDIRSGIVFRATFKDLITTRSLIDFDSFTGQYYRFRLSMLQFVDRNQRLGFSTQFFIDNTILPVLNVRNETGRFYNRIAQTSFSITNYLGLNHLMNLSLNIGNNTFIPEFVAPGDIKKLTFKYLSGSYNYKVNSLDTKSFPRKGTLFSLSAKTSKLFSGTIRTSFLRDQYTSGNPGLFSFKRAYSFTASLKNYIPKGNKLTFSLSANLLYSIDQDTVASLNNLFYLGGIESISTKSIPAVGFHSCEIPVDQLVGIGAGLDLKIAKDLYFSLATNIFAVNEVHEHNRTSILGGYGIGLGYMSIIGPIKAGIMHGISSTERYYHPLKGYISIGYSF